MSHTPGPWDISETAHFISAGTYYASPSGWSITAATVGSYGPGRRKGDPRISVASVYENEANARLIAAAPDLLAELKRVTAGFERCIVSAGSDPEFASEAVQTAKAAIAKATGEAVPA